MYSEGEALRTSERLSSPCRSSQAVCSSASVDAHSLLTDERIETTENRGWPGALDSATGLQVVSSLDALPPRTWGDCSHEGDTPHLKLQPSLPRSAPSEEEIDAHQDHSPREIQTYPSLHPADLPSQLSSLLFSDMTPVTQAKPKEEEYIGKADQRPQELEIWDSAVEEHHMRRNAEAAAAGFDLERASTAPPATEALAPSLSATLQKQIPFLLSELPALDLDLEQLARFVCCLAGLPSTNSAASPFQELAALFGACVEAAMRSSQAELLKSI
ncbi:hypothetical protein Efla_001394 [Eimeria flavescens]